jgi:CRP-like cAMP-binding protein
MLSEEQELVKAYFKSFSILTDRDIERFIQLSAKRKLKKSDFFIREGQICKEVAFVLKGTLRSFYISNKGSEITYCITFPDNLTTAYSSFITGDSTPENIQCMTPVEMLSIQKKEIDDLAAKSPNWMKFLKIMAERQYIELEKRIFQLQKGNALQRYVELEKKQPELIQNIPLQHLASYLGVTQRHLSRIRKNK